MVAWFSGKVNGAFVGFSQVGKVKKKNYERNSLMCDMEYKLQVARETRDEPVIYFPHNVDFRGRAYPMHPYLSHLSSDVCRAMLQFSEAKPLGEKGLEWLCIQAANLYGANKMSLYNRKQFILDNMEKVRDSASDPLGGELWWVDADEPWQCLAVCKEIVRAIDSGNPAAYMSHLPVHQVGGTAYLLTRENPIPFSASPASPLSSADT